MPDGDPKPPLVDPKEASFWLRYAGMGMELAAGTVGCLLLGWFIDRQLDSYPIGLTVGAVIGTVGGFYNFIRKALRLAKHEQELAHRRHQGDHDVPDDRNRAN